RSNFNIRHEQTHVSPWSVIPLHNDLIGCTQSNDMHSLMLQANCRDSRSMLVSALGHPHQHCCSSNYTTWSVGSVFYTLRNVSTVPISTNNASRTRLKPILTTNGCAAQTSPSPESLLRSFCRLPSLRPVTLSSLLVPLLFLVAAVKFSFAQLGFLSSPRCLLLLLLVLVLELNLLVIDLAPPKLALGAYHAAL
ncbi:unnamed protein product, partial [Ectocarpus sp. 6 AP-2014]